MTECFNNEIKTIRTPSKMFQFNVDMRDISTMNHKMLKISSKKLPSGEPYCWQMADFVW